MKKKKKMRGGKKRKKPKQVNNGPIWVRPGPNDPLIAVAFRYSVENQALEYWAILQGETLDPGSTSWVCQEFSNPTSQPAGAPNPTQAQFKTWAETCMKDSHGVVPALDFYKHEITTFS